MHLDLDQAIAWQASQRPPLTLKLKRRGRSPDPQPRETPAKRSRIIGHEPGVGGGLERGVRPIGDWSTLMTLIENASPSISRCGAGRGSSHRGAGRRAHRGCH